MKHLLMLLLVASAGATLAQNQISTLPGQPLKVWTDTMIVNGHISLNSGQLFFDGSQLMAIKKTNPDNINILVGPGSGNRTMTGQWNSLFGEGSGTALTTGSNNTFLGRLTGPATTDGSSNVFIGHKSGVTNTRGSFNVFAGNGSGRANTLGHSNLFLGMDAGYGNATGYNNVFLGRDAGRTNDRGFNNTFLGTNSGVNNRGMGNVFLGYGAGGAELSGSNKLYIANSETTTPLIYGDFAAGKLVFNGKIGANTSTFPNSVTLYPSGGTVNTSGYQLFVKGGILAEAVTVAGGWADYVFEKGYKLKALSEVETFIAENGHLPNVPSSREVESSGVNLGEMTRIQQEKIEELTLYLINLSKEIEGLKKIILELADK
ncbi:hypothetical protein [Dyadobacter bucti]|uniref:hypothetical protein n=1 Tax=Dyadobacter bucti TaxID=2572203 RepID=UPI001109E9AC|nr:hypothetical protein [Dyadobacter bucti]